MKTTNQPVLALQTTVARSRPFTAPDRWRSARGWQWTLAAVVLALTGCASVPQMPYSADASALTLLAAQAGVTDQRGRFREIYCATLDVRGHDIPDYRTCDEALTRVGTEPAGTGRPVELGASKLKLIAAVVPGIGYDCFLNWLAPQGTVAAHMRKFGYDQTFIKVDALSGTETNARQIRDAVMAMDDEPGAPRIVLIGYSKGAPDVLEAVVRYPEIRGRVAAVISAAGAVGGSPLANDAEQYQANLLQYFPGATCTVGDGGGVESLRPATRKAWLAANNPLPAGPRYYSLVTYPQPERISKILQSSYDKIARLDGRNDSQMIFYDQVIPGSTLLAFLNADHWALVLPIARTHATVSELFVTQNAYPREALLEAVLRFVEEDLASNATR